MTTGRTILKHTRFYADGYDLSGYSRSLGPLAWVFDEGDLTCWPDGVKGALPGHATIGFGALNGVFDNTPSSGLHVVMNGAGVKRAVMIPIGIQAAPAQGDPVFMGEFVQGGYYQEGDNSLYANIPFGNWAVDGGSLLYNKPWGWLLHAKGAETGANTAVGIDDNAAASAFGGFLMYQVFAGDGTATIKIQEADTNLDGSFADLTGATSGSIDCSTPKYGLVALSRTAAVKRYLRWQLALGTANTVTFALGFVRALF